MDGLTKGNLGDLTGIVITEEMLNDPYLLRAVLEDYFKRQGEAQEKAELAYARFRQIMKDKGLAKWMV